MKPHPVMALGAAALVLLAPVASAHKNSALIDALVRKGILTPAEAAEIQAEVEEEQRGSSEGKLKLSSALTELKLSGELRIRSQYDSLSPQVADSDAGQHRLRFRYGLRLNADFKLGPDWFGGLQVTVSPNADSTFVTYGEGFGNTPLFLSRAYVGWNAADWATFVLGKQPNPFFTTALLWDSDINPAGLTGSFDLHTLFGHDDESPWKVQLTSGAYAFANNNRLHLDGAYLFANQLQVTYEFTPTRSLTLAPGHQIYNRAAIDRALNSLPFDRVSTDPWVTPESANLSLIHLPGEFRFHFGSLPLALQWHGVYNLKASERVLETYNLDSHAVKDDFAFLVGFRVGEHRKAGDWSLVGDFRQVGIGSIDPNINDSTWGLSRLNLRGFRGGLGYSFTDFAVGQVNYFSGWNVRKNLTGGQATNGASIANANTVEIVQVELNVKF